MILITLTWLSLEFLVVAKAFVEILILYVIVIRYLRLWENHSIEAETGFVSRWW